MKFRQFVNLQDESFYSVFKQWKISIHNDNRPEGRLVLLCRRLPASHKLERLRAGVIKGKPAVAFSEINSTGLPLLQFLISERIGRKHVVPVGVGARVDDVYVHIKG